jgi:hypothetical protein
MEPTYCKGAIVVCEKCRTVEPGFDYSMRTRRGRKSLSMFYRLVGETPSHWLVEHTSPQERFELSRAGWRPAFKAIRARAAEGGHHLAFL